ncbi:hypothetical protein CFOLD11_22700 [Clostridium folliculivorans]|uniref:Uncharacterized protein n=1 Tax=Clostridium folliculivorans TaxID=2886038 RepID=A0A9W5Y2L4_9CLOT|nr:hypothetical protein [Clostridium folliculivorans]GKU25444.1 hypothetical protein CFOLD11_22700 [Clostridium folliculivorans]
MHFSKKKLVDLILLFLLFTIIGIIVYFYLPNANLTMSSILYNNTANKIEYKKDKTGDEVSEIYLTPVPITKNLQLVSTLLSTSDLTFGYLDKSEDADINFLNKFVNEKGVNLIFAKDDQFDTLSKLGVNLCSSKSYFQANYQGKRINFIYIDVDNESTDNFNRMMNAVKDLKKNKLPVVIYVDSSKPLNDEYIKVLSKTGANLVLTSSYDKYKFKLINNTVFVNNCNNTETNYIPQFSFIFYKNYSVSIGIKLIITDYEKKDSVIKDLNNRSYNIPFKISEKFNYIDY